MKHFWFTVYNWIVVPIFWTVFHCCALFNSKIRRGIRGRSNLFNRIEQDVRKLKRRKRIWFHSSSLGEFEQAKPIIAALRQRFDQVDIIVSFFSPSGYEHSKNYKLANLITYIPFDSRANARRFLDLVRPDAAVLVRYDIWPNHVWELGRRGIPVIIANATLRSSSARLFGPLKSFHHYVYESLTSILTVSEADAASFRSFHLEQPEIRVVGETRYDQVWQRSEEARSRHLIPNGLLGRRTIIVAGSTWEEDEEVLLPAFRRVTRQDHSALMILVPHEPTIETIERLEAQLASLGLQTIRFSGLNDYSREQVIIVDSVGILTTLYRYAHVTYVGGSFKQGIHNVLEPAVYGVPVLYGPKHENSREAVEMARRKSGFVVHNKDECYRILHDLLNNRKRRQTAGSNALALVKENMGATERFMEYIVPIVKLKT